MKTAFNECTCLMFTRKACRTLALAALAASGTLIGCRKPPDPQEYGEIITAVPDRLNKPFPLPELEKPPVTGKKVAE